MVSLIVLILVTPASANYTARPGLWLTVLSTLVFFSALYAVSHRRTTLIIAAILLLPSLTNHWLSQAYESMPMTVAQASSSILFYGFTLIVLFRYVTTGEDVTDDKLYGAISVYLLLGAVFAWIYMLIETIQPGSFYIDPARDPNRTMNWADLMYFSFVTLTTLGYGDIAPLSPHARALAIVEAMTGVMYVAVMVAGIVGSLVASKAEREIHDDLPPR